MIDKTVKESKNTQFDPFKVGPLEPFTVGVAHGSLIQPLRGLLTITSLQFLSNRASKTATILGDSKAYALFVKSNHSGIDDFKNRSFWPSNATEW